MWKHLFALGILTASLSLVNTASAEAVLRLAGTSWCPYTCNYKSLPGYVTEYYRSLLAPMGIRLEVELMDWEHAVALTESGQFDGLITAAVGEVEGLVMSSQPTDTRSSCFYRRHEASWRYQGLESLADQRLGIIAGYSYGEPLDSWLGQAPDASELYMAQGKQPLSMLVQALLSGEVTVLIEDSNVLEHWLHRRGVEGIERGHCQAEAPFFIALSPDYPEVDALLKQIDDALQLKESRLLRQGIKKRYGLIELFEYRE